MPTLRQDDGVFAAALESLENALERDTADAAAINPILRTLGDNRPFDITADDLRRLIHACYRLIGVDGGVDFTADGNEPAVRDHLRWNSRFLIEQSFHDARRFGRGSIERSVDHARILQPTRIEERASHYHPMPNVPLHRDAARELIAPYLSQLGRLTEDDPTGHLKFAWDAVTNPLPPFEGLVWDWLDARGQGEDMRLALSLDALTRRGQQRMNWSRFETHVLPHLASDSPLVVSHAARFIGSLFGDAKDRMQGQGAWSGLRILAQIAGLPRHRRVAAGGFLNGIDAMDPDPFAELARIAPRLDITDWVMMVLEERVEEPFLPGSQMFWFYLHEHYDRDPDMVLRFIKAGHADIAWMCITENHPPAAGMDAPLRLLAEAADPKLAEMARRLLGQLRAT